MSSNTVMPFHFQDSSGEIPCMLACETPQLLYMYFRQQNIVEEQVNYPQGNVSTGATSGTHNSVGSAAPLPYNATMVPLQVRLPHKNPRPPTLAECEVIIRHLQQHNDKQAHEVRNLNPDKNC